jgi:tetratricopeptide (TPR) repeat protein
LEDYADAVFYLEQALAVGQKIGHPTATANALCNLGTARAALGETAAAAGLYGEALSLKQEGGDLRTQAGTLEIVAVFLADQEKPERTAHRKAACRLWGLAEKLRENFDSPRPPREQDSYDLAIGKVRQSLESEAVEAAWAEGRTMTLAEAIALAIQETETVRGIYERS